MNKETTTSDLFYAVRIAQARTAKSVSFIGRIALFSQIPVLGISIYLLTQSEGRAALFLAATAAANLILMGWTLVQMPRARDLLKNSLVVPEQ